MAKKPKILIIRWGAIGDHVFLTPVYPLLKRDGWNITVHMKESGLPIVKNNPYIDRVIIETSNPPNDKEFLKSYWAGLSKGYDKCINLSGSVESALLFNQSQPEWLLPKEERHKIANKNYYDQTLEWCGYPDVKGQNGQVYFSPMEESWGREFKKKHGKFLVVWSLSGSAHHKAYPYAEIVARSFLAEHPDAHMVLTGDGYCRLLTWSHPQVTDYAGHSIRNAMILTKYANLVIGTETGLLNVAGCFDTPKITMLSHSSVENWTKYWTNTTNVVADVPCRPCHLLHYTLETCLHSKKTLAPICMDKIEPEVLYAHMNEAYRRWRDG